MCDCHFFENFTDGQKLLCNYSVNPKQFIFQAILQSINGKTAEELQKEIEKWVLTEPFVTIAGKSYQVNPECSVVIQEIGDTSCHLKLPSQLESSADSRGNNLYTTLIIGIGSCLGVLLVLFFIGITICIITCILRKKKKTENYFIR